jgi:hypothetical protein
MLVACRLAGLSALEAHYADDNAQAQPGVEEQQERRRPRPSEGRALAQRELQGRHSQARRTGGRVRPIAWLVSLIDAMMLAGPAHAETLTCST